MCKKTKYHKTSNTQIDKCMRNLIRILNEQGFKTIASCCGHGKYPMTILVKCTDNFAWEIMSDKLIRRKRNFYKKDKQGYYYIPEVIEYGKNN